MTRRVRAPVPMQMLAACALCALVGACGPDDGEVCAVESGDGVWFDVAAVAERECEKLSSYRLFVGELADLTANEGVVPYDLNSPLFSDYATKQRFLWLPEGTSMTYHPEDTFEMRVGTVIVKSFSYLDDIRVPDGPRQQVETRIMYRTDERWAVTTYVWDETQTEAYRQIAGARTPVRWLHYDGAERALDYSIPNQNQCKNCHEEHDDVTAPIGPKARHLNRRFDYPDGPQNQLEYLAAAGLLAGLPADLATVPRAPVWNDEQTGTLEERARSWLDINCAHCHNPTGAARTSGLDLSHGQANPYEYGVCKGPVATGGGSGGHSFNIVPGQPDESILVYRLESTELDVRMPEVGRQQVHEESTALIRAWIESLPGDCSTVAGEPTPISGRTATMGVELRAHPVGP